MWTLVPYWVLYSEPQSPSAVWNEPVSAWEIGPLFLGSFLIYGDKIKCSDTELELRLARSPAKVLENLNKCFWECELTRVFSVYGTCEAAVNSSGCRSNLILSSTGINILWLGKDRGLVWPNWYLTRFIIVIPQSIKTTLFKVVCYMKAGHIFDLHKRGSKCVIHAYEDFGKIMCTFASL